MDERTFADWDALVRAQHDLHYEPEYVKVYLGNHHLYHDPSVERVAFVASYVKWLPHLLATVPYGHKVYVVLEHPGTALVKLPNSPAHAYVLAALQRRHPGLPLGKHQDVSQFLNEVREDVSGEDIEQALSDGNDVTLNYIAEHVIDPVTANELATRTQSGGGSISDLHLPARRRSTAA